MKEYKPPIRRCILLGFALSAGASCGPLAPEKQEQKPETIRHRLEGAAGGFSVAVPQGYPFIITNRRTRSQDALIIVLDLDGLEDHASEASKQMISRFKQVRAARLSKLKQEQSGFELRPDACLEPELTLIPRREESVPKKMARSTPKWPWFKDMKPIDRFGLTGYIERRYQNQVNSPTYISQRITMSKSEYFVVGQDAAGNMHFSCTNEFGLGSGGCAVLYDLSDTVMLDYRQCTPMLPDWRLVRDTMASIANDFIVDD